MEKSVSGNSVLKGFPGFLHGGDYNPDQWLEQPEILEEDFRLMDKAHCNAFSVGIFSWGQIEVEEGKFEFGWLDELFDRAAKYGKRLFLATPSAAKPGWMGKKYPETCLVKRDGVRLEWCARQTNCLHSPVFREGVAAVNRKLAERYADHPALAGWHISNEYGSECFCPVCREKFHAFLEERYRTLENLNRCYWSAFWGHHLTAWDQIDPCDDCIGAVRLDWRRFMTRTVADFMRMEVAAVREFSDLPATTNMMGMYLPLNYFEIAKACDFIADDCYPSWYNGRADEAASDVSMLHDMHYTMMDKPFLMMESCPGVTNWKPYMKMRRPGEFEREMLLALGHGADGTMYFQWRKGLGNCEQFHGAVVGHDGTSDTLVFRSVAEYGEKLGGIAGAAGSRKAPAGAALLFDWEARWALDFARAFGGAERKKHDETIRLHYRTLWEKNLELAVIGPEQEFDRYKLIVAPMLFLLRRETAGRLTRFVERGGTLVMTYLSGCVDENNHCFAGGNPGGPELRKLFGIWSEDIDGLEPSDSQALRYGGGCHEVCDYAELIHAEGAEVLASYERDFYAGTPAVTVNRYGKGKAVYLGARTGLDFLRKFYGDLTRECGLSPVLPGLPETVRAARRIASDGSEYFFLANMGEGEAAVRLPEPMADIWNGAAAAASVRLPPRGSAVLKR
ncbi:beta-galactosidase [Victivallis lenta]|uniref:beta-galactosidase n=1 Tax=Victivallis lenta TaxID=2606640 RepID=UPI003AB4B195